MNYCEIMIWKSFKKDYLLYWEVFSSLGTGLILEFGASCREHWLGLDDSAMRTKRAGSGIFRFTLQIKRSWFLEHGRWRNNNLVTNFYSRVCWRFIYENFESIIGANLYLWKYWEHIWAKFIFMKPFAVYLG